MYTRCLPSCFISNHPSYQNLINGIKIIFKKLRTERKNSGTKNFFIDVRRTGFVNSAEWGTKTNDFVANATKTKMLYAKAESQFYSHNVQNHKIIAEK